MLFVLSSDSCNYDDLGKPNTNQLYEKIVVLVLCMSVCIVIHCLHVHHVCECVHVVKERVIYSCSRPQDARRETIKAD